MCSTTYSQFTFQSKLPRPVVDHWEFTVWHWPANHIWISPIWLLMASKVQLKAPICLWPCPPQGTPASIAFITNLGTAHRLYLHWEYSFLVDLFHLIYSKPYFTFLSLLFNTVLGILKYLLSRNLIITTEYVTYACPWSMYLTYIISLTLPRSWLTFTGEETQTHSH